MQFGVYIRALLALEPIGGQAEARRGYMFNALLQFEGFAGTGFRF